MKKYLISIEKEPSRRLQQFFAQDTFKNFKSDFVVKGVKGVDVPTKDYFQLAVLGKKKALTPGELGCTLSHLAAYQDFLKSSEEYAIFFEDDAIQNQFYDLNELENNVKDLQLVSGFLLSLGGIQLPYSRKVKGRFLVNKLFDQPVLDIHPFFYKNLSSTYAYMVDRQMAQILVDYHQSPRGCDHWEELAYLKPIPHLYATYLFEHPPIEGEGSHSYIDAERQNFFPHHKVKVNLIETIWYSFIKRILKLILKSF